MAKYLVIASYSPDGLKGVISKGGTSRVEAVKKAASKLRGSVESFYFAFGEADAYVVCDLPDNVTAAALSMQVSSTGLAATRIVVLLTAEEVDRAVKVGVDYAPPGA